jgi:hypothetical protein
VSVQTKAPSSNAVEQSYPQFTNPGNAYASDSSGATAAISAPSNQDFANRYGGFGFSIPSGATITNVTVNVRYKYSAGTTGSSGMQWFGFLYRTGSTTLVNNGLGYSFASPTPRGAAGSPAYATYQTESFDVTSLRTWVDTDFDANFKLGLDARFAGAAGTVDLDYAEVVVTYTGGSSGGGRTGFFLGAR